MTLSWFTSGSRNLALNKPAWQSSTKPYSDFYGFEPAAGFAVDGDKSPMYWVGSCSHTEEDRPKAWWIVDLEGEYMVTEVVITNRGDCCGKSIGFIIGMRVLRIRVLLTVELVKTKSAHLLQCESN